MHSHLITTFFVKVTQYSMLFFCLAHAYTMYTFNFRYFFVNLYYCETIADIHKVLLVHVCLPVVFFIYSTIFIGEKKERIVHTCTAVYIFFTFSNLIK